MNISSQWHLKTYQKKNTDCKVPGNSMCSTRTQQAKQKHDSLIYVWTPCSLCVCVSFNSTLSCPASAFESLWWNEATIINRNSHYNNVWLTIFSNWMSIVRWMMLISSPAVSLKRLIIELTLKTNFPAEVKRLKHIHLFTFITQHHSSPVYKHVLSK